MQPEADQLLPLLRAAGLPDTFTLSRLSGGGNNRVYRLESASRAALLKSYFRNADDPRDRLGTEFAFTRFAWEQGIRCVPQPLAAEAAHGLALYEFIEGRPLLLAEVNRDRVNEAFDFHRALNAHRPGGLHLPDASEACFTVAQHLATLDRRLARLTHLEAVTESGREARALVADRLLPLGTRIIDAAESNARRAGIDPDAPIHPGDRRLSPSDFGFHNALAREGNLVFLDFEYAGWDDPAKTVCDFFCQPALPAPESLFDDVARSVADGLSPKTPHLERIRLMMPVYRLKWCCIMLNEFLPAGDRRRTFARPEEPEERRVRQLHKVRAALDRFV